MTELVQICLILLTYAVGAGVTIVFLRRLHDRCEVVAIGVVSGVPVSLQYRWFVLLHDYVGVGFGAALLFGGLGFGFFAAAEVVENPTIVMLCYYCASTLAWGSVLTTIFVVSWIVHLVRVLRARNA